jgi:hypothetical protein
MTVFITLLVGSAASQEALEDQDSLPLHSTPAFKAQHA